MTTSVFDPNTFASMTFEGANSTEAIPVPALDDYVGITGQPKIEAWQSRDNPEKKGLKMQVPIECEDPRAAEVTGRPKFTLTYEAMLDLTETGMLDMSKGMNVRLGRFRAAIGLNDGSPWTFDMFAGRSIKFSVKHRPYENRLVAEIKDVAPVN